jgi:hypothetical protein
MITVQDRSFSFVRGSDVQLDGMYLEASEIIEGKVALVAEVFYSDENHLMTFTAFAADVPIEAVE